MEKQLQMVHDIQKMIYNLENLEVGLHLQLENVIDEAISFYEKEIASQNIDQTNYDRELYRFNYENLEGRHKYAG